MVFGTKQCEAKSIRLDRRGQDKVGWNDRGALHVRIVLPSPKSQRITVAQSRAGLFLVG